LTDEPFSEAAARDALIDMLFQVAAKGELLKIGFDGFLRRNPPPPGTCITPEDKAIEAEFNSLLRTVFDAGARHLWGALRFLPRPGEPASPKHQALFEAIDRELWVDEDEDEEEAG